MLVGYVRVSTDDQNLNLQKDALLKFGILKKDFLKIILRIYVQKKDTFSVSSWRMPSS